MQRPKRRQNERIIDRLRGGPDVLEPEWADYARILSQMRFIVPKESSMENSDVRGKNKYNQENRPKPGSSPKEPNH